MALTDIVFSQGDIQNFVLEIPQTSYSGTLYDITSGCITSNYGELVEIAGKKYPVIGSSIIKVDR